MSLAGPELTRHRSTECALPLGALSAGQPLRLPAVLSAELIGARISWRAERRASAGSSVGFPFRVVTGR